METITVQTEKISGFIDLIRIMLLIALFGLMICFESSAQVPDKTCCNPLHCIDIEYIRHFLAYLDSIELSEDNKDPENQTDSNLIAQLENEWVQATWILSANEPGWKISTHFPTSAARRNLLLDGLMYKPLVLKNNIKAKV